MGKKLIIMGADFTLNGIASGELTFYNDYSDAVLNASNPFSSENTFHVLSSELSRLNLSGKTIRYVKLYAKQAGTIRIGTYSGSGATVSGDTSYQVTVGVNIITLVAPITINSTHLPAFTGMNILSFWTDNDDTKGWKFGRVNSTSTYPNNRIPISFGAIVSPQ